MARILILFACIHLFNVASSTEKLMAKNPPVKDTKGTDTRPRALRQGEEDQDTPSSTTESEPQNCVCSKIYDPVCADNGKSYYNICHMECDVDTNHNLTVVHQGNCIPF